MIIFFTVLQKDDDIDFFKISMLQFAKVNDYDFIFYIYSYDTTLKFDSRFIIKDLKELNPKKYNLKYSHYVTIFKFFEFSKKYKDSFICYISNSLLCLKSLLPLIQSVNFEEKTLSRFQEGIILAGVRDVQNKNYSNSYRLYARKCLSIRTELYLSQSIIITKGFHVYRHEFQDFINMCPIDLINPEMDFINWYFKNRIKYLDDSACANYTNENINDIYAYDYNTDFKPTSMPFNYIKYIDKNTINKIIKDFDIFYNVIKTLMKNNNISFIIEKIKNNQNFISECMDDFDIKDSFVRRYILKCSD